MDNWLLDTSYILPYFGINIDLPGLKENMKIIQNKFSKYFKITNCSLIEAKWKANSLFRKENNESYLERANDAMLSLSSATYFELIEPWSIPGVSSIADELLKAGHTDYMDCWIFATAKRLNLKIISEDKKIRKIINNLNNWNALKIYFWKDFIIEYQEILNLDHANSVDLNLK